LAEEKIHKIFHIIVSTRCVFFNFNLVEVGKAGGLHSPFGCAPAPIGIYDSMVHN